MRRKLAALLYAGALACLSFWLLVAIEGWWSQASLSHRLDELGVASHGAHRSRLEARRSGLVGRIQIERLGLSAVVVEGTSDQRLLRGVGHLRGTAFPGERGNAVLAAHRDTYFRRLRGVRPGDDVLVTTLDGIFAYRVDSTLIVPPDRTDLLAPARGRAMTLVTCYPFHWIGPAPDRFLVCASLVRAGPRPVSGRSAVRANLSREARPALGM